MTARYAFAVGIAGMAALAAWMVTHRRGRPLEIDDDSAADIIRRFNPALHAAWTTSQLQTSAY